MPGGGKPETPTTYDAIEGSQGATEASQPHRQPSTTDATADVDYEPVEPPQDKHMSVDNGQVSDQYLSVISEPAGTIYQNVAITAPEAGSSSQQSTPRPKPKPRLTKEPSTDSYTEMYSYTPMSASRNQVGATDSLALDETVPPPPEEEINNKVGNHHYYNQDAFSKSTSKQHAQKKSSPETPSRETDENLYCNQSAFIRGKR